MHELKVIEVCRNVFNVQSKTIKELRHTWIRFEEAYENPIHAFKKTGKGFSRKTIEKWWKSTEEGKEHEYWFDAFNLPSYILKHFYAGEFDPLDANEQQLLDTLLPIYKKRKKFYIIGTKVNPNSTDFDHEMAHALYYVSKKYRKDSARIIAKMNKETVEKLKHYLHFKNGYGKHVLDDEMQAWVLAGEAYIIKRARINYKRDLLPYRIEMKKLYLKTIRKMKSRR